MRFDELIRNLRKEAGMTQEVLAQRAGVPLPSLRGHEQGQRTPSWANVVKLARALGVSTDAFSECEEVTGEKHAAPSGKPAKGKTPAKTKTRKEK